MDRRIGKHFTIPAASMSTITILTVLIWLPFYDKKVVPFVRRYTGKERGITFIQKIAVGIALLKLAEMVKALVENKRRRAAAHYGLVYRPQDIIPISAFWLVPQFVISGLSESFMMIGHLEFFYYMLPEHMTSTGSALSLVAYAIGANLSTFALHAIQKITQRHGQPGWLSNNINEAHLDYFYGLLTVWLFLDFMLFLVVARWYKRQMHLNQMMLQSS
jgi:peptide/histidine transporter 3/4